MNRYQKKCMRLAKVQHKVKILCFEKNLSQARKNGKTLLHQWIAREYERGINKRYRLYKILFKRKKLSELDEEIQLRTETLHKMQSIK